MYTIYHKDLRYIFEERNLGVLKKGLELANQKEESTTFKTSLIYLKDNQGFICFSHFESWHLVERTYELKRREFKFRLSTNNVHSSVGYLNLLPHLLYAVIQD